MDSYKEIVQKIKPEFDKTMSFLEKEIMKLHTGRATPALVEDMTVECFGDKYPLKQLAAISTPEPKLIVIHPWDKSYVEPIERALRNSSLGFSPVVDKDLIRISIPPLSEESRKIYSRILSEKQEEARRTVRKWREDAWREIQDKEREGEIREDDKFRAKEDLQKLIDDYHKKIEDIGEKKRKEIME